MNGSLCFKLLFTTFQRRSIAITRAHRLYSDVAGSNNQSSPARETWMDRAARDSLKLEHSKFIAEAHQTEGWTESDGSPGKLEPKSRKGRLLPTSSHLFKLVLPLPGLRPAEKDGPAAAPDRPPPTVFLLHPSQPLSHIARLIQASLPSPTDGPQPYAPRLPTVSFQNLEDDNNTGHQSPHQWADSTDIGDFVKEAVHSQEFTIIITPDKASNTAQLAYNDAQAPSSASGGTPAHDKKDPDAFAPLEIPVSVPSFDERTRFLRRRRERLQKELEGMQDIKDMCDTAARKGARRLATGGFLVLLTYWVAVLRLTFFTHLGWDFMEVGCGQPVTYLTEFLAIMGGYAWFLRQGREISYTSILNQSVSTRRRALYASKGLDIERWAELVTEEKAISREIEKIREDYEGGWKEGKKANNVEVEKAKPAADEPDVKDAAATTTHPGDALLDDALLKKAAAGKTDPAEDKAVEIKREEIVADDEKATDKGTLPPRRS